MVQCTSDEILLLVRLLYNFSAFQRKCKHIGGHLVKIDDGSENAWLKSQIAGINFYVCIVHVVEGTLNLSI